MTALCEWVFRYFKSPFLHGKAFKRFACKDYPKAAEILQRLCKGNENEQGIEYTYRLLGECYLKFPPFSGQVVKLK